MEGNIKNKIFSGLFWKFGERITAQAVSLIVSIILARLLSPDDYGVVALIMIFITFANVFVVNGFGSALIQKKDADELDFSSVFYVNIFISLIIYLLIFVASPFIAGFYNMPILNVALRILGLRIIIAAVNSVQQAYVARNMMFKRFFWSTLFGTVVSGVVGIWMAYKGFGLWSLVFQYLTNTFVDTIVLWFTVKWRPLLKCSFERAKGLISYGWKLLVSALIDTGYMQLRNLIIGKLYTAEDLAFYNQGDKYPSVLCTNINTAISSVLFPAMSQFQNDPIKVKNMTRKSIQVSSYVMWPLTLGLATVAKPLVSLLLTDKWLPCVPYLQIFCFTYGLWPIHTSNLQAIKAVGRSDLFLKLEIIKKIVGLIALLVSMPFGPLVMAASLIVTGIISTIVNSFPNKKLLNYSYFEQLQDMLPSFGIALVMALLVYSVGYLNLNNWIMLCIQIPIGILVYAVLSIITKQNTLVYIWNLIKKR